MPWINKFFVSTASNAESRLLRLPQEIKDQIYALVLGERLLHVRYDVKAKSLSLRPCQARISEREAQDVFASSKEPWSAVELMDRNGPCYDVRTILGDYCDCISQVDHV